jgi:hypothetical protein
MTVRDGRRAAVAITALLVSTWAGLPLDAVQNPFKIFGGGKGVTYKVYKDPAGRFQIEYPPKELKTLPTGGGSLAIFARNEGPAVFVDHVALEAPLTPGEVAQMPEMELDRLKKQEPETKDFRSSMVEGRAGRGVLIQYSRIGKGRERAVHYTVVVNQDLFRVHGVVPETLAAKYEPIVLHMIQSFTSPAERAAPAPPKN